VADEWDYGAVAADYDARPPYAEQALAAGFAATGVTGGERACDVGAGTGRLTLTLMERGLEVVAVEPSPAMRARGVAKTQAAPAWIAGRAEALPLRAASCRLVSFGSSFNVVDRDAALAESARVLVPGGRLLCVWNYRALGDPLQERIEALIRAHVPGYAYGIRRADQRAALVANGKFRRVEHLEVTCVHRVRVATWMQAWRSHVTLRRQAGVLFDQVLDAIGELVRIEAGDEISVPYVTRAWVAERVGSP
jgi:SAM-dependent methyltransferase